ncbi:hypothetical protein LBMAG47_23600 [Planctomycetia bacterium]|nr:hypothetical protein LBMAG47_23600 [Planctomycetia bacterium]
MAGRPVAAFAGLSGSWIVTALTSAGTVIGFLHLGQGPVCPANLSLTLNRDEHAGQMTGMGM